VRLERLTLSDNAELTEQIRALQEAPPSVGEEVAKIIDDVRAHGDEAVARYTGADFAKGRARLWIWNELTRSRIGNELAGHQMGTGLPLTIFTRLPSTVPVWPS